MPRLASNPVEQYIAAMRATHSLGSHTAETSFYTPLINLINTIGETLKPKVLFVAHPGSRGAGLPDGGLYPKGKKDQTAPTPGQRPERGAVEIKPPGDSLITLAQSEQVLRYLREYGLCLITNYHQFQLVELRNGQPSVMESYDLTLTASDLWNLPAARLAKRHRETLPDFLSRVLTRKVPLVKPKDVAELLASYAREARERASDHPLAAFEGVKSALQESLGITFEGDKGEHFFLSTLIQTLFYGIFSAWILWRRTPDYAAQRGVFDWRLSADYLRIPVLRALFHAVSERGALNTVQIKEVLDHATEALNRVQPDFFTTFREEDAVQYFYEPFLEAFDPELRKQLGVWYTPREIVRYMVERVDHLLRTELNEPLGLASPNVQVLDPCCGTGAYLVEVLHRIERTLREQAGDDNALVGSDLRRAATTRIFGFEIMPAPFVIAHLQIAQLLEDAHASLTADQRALIYLTNALTGWVPMEHPKTLPGFPEFLKERDAAEAVKQADTILVILGNPPYNGYAGIAKVEEERNLTTAYRTPILSLPAPQGQGLNDLYVRFFRIAERRVVGDKSARGNRDGRGIISFISNNAWLDGLSHVSMRAHYLATFSSIYIDNLNGDKYRTGKTTPDGKPDPSAFSTSQNSEGIQVGTAITTLVRIGSQRQRNSLLETFAPGPLRLFSEEASENFFDQLTQWSNGGLRPFIPSRAARGRNVWLRNLWGTQKLSHLNREAMQRAKPVYNAIAPTPALGVPFADRAHTAAYGTWARLPDLFPAFFPGIKTSRDPVVVEIDKERLVERMCFYLDSKNSDEEVALKIPFVMADAPGFNAKATRELLKTWQDAIVSMPFKKLPNYSESEFRRHLTKDSIVSFYYRPFDVRWLYYQGTSTLVNRPRPEYFAAFDGAGVWLLTSQSNRRSYDPPCIARSLSSLHVIEKGTAAFPLFSAKPPSLLDEGSSLYNVDDQTLIKPHRFQDDFFFHALTTMHTPRYGTENSGALLNDWPRIPLPATAELLTHSANLGHRLADLLDPESDIHLVAEWSFLARLSIAAEFPEGTPDRDNRNKARFALTAGWGGRGQGDTVMPRRGKAPERDWTPAELGRLATLAATQSLTLDDALTLLGDRCADVYLNGASYWGSVPIKVWEYTLGGYQVLKKWLSYREEPLLGRPLHEDEARYFAQVARRIAAILLMGPALDASYAAILPTATGLPSQPNI